MSGAFDRYLRRMAWLRELGPNGELTAEAFEEFRRRIQADDEREAAEAAKATERARR